MYSVQDDSILKTLPGFPIQKSSGHSSFDNSPKLIAVCYVFHRLSAPRHPPCALYSLSIPSHSFGAESSLDSPESRIINAALMTPALDFIRMNSHSFAHFSLSLSSLLFSILNRFPMGTRRTRRPYTRCNPFCQIFFSKKVKTAYAHRA